MASAAPHPYSGTLLQAEVPAGAQADFERRYAAATGSTVSAGGSADYQAQDNKWGPELRIYFNDPALAASFNASGHHVEQGRSGYLSGSYAYRINNNDLWWELVETHGLHLGLN
jgi:hypothetical protein